MKYLLVDRFTYYGLSEYPKTKSSRGPCIDILTNQPVYFNGSIDDSQKICFFILCELSVLRGYGPRTGVTLQD